MFSVKRIIHNENFKSSVGIVIILVVFFGTLFGLGLFFNVSVRVVESGSMCVPYSGPCDGWTHPFESTLHKGDIIIIQGVDPKDLNANYPNSDIIVYNRPDNLTETPIVHRIVAVTEIDGKFYFQTKGDGNGQRWPAPVVPSQYDASWMSGYPDGVPQDFVLGRVVMRFLLWLNHSIL
jgi:signal peptidase I